jgi:hypothetical protein
MCAWPVACAQITSTDIYYLEDVELARSLVELGWVRGRECVSLHEVHACCVCKGEGAHACELYVLVVLGRRVRGNGEVVKREEFEQRKEAAETARQARLNKKPKRLASQGKSVEEFPLLQVRPAAREERAPLHAHMQATHKRYLACMQALKDREEAVRNGKLTTIIFIRDKNAKGQEVSGYIDYGHRLKAENLEPVFDRKKRLMPRPTDLSFYNWETQMSTSNPTPNFQVRQELRKEGAGKGSTRERAAPCGGRKPEGRRTHPRPPCCHSFLCAGDCGQRGGPAVQEQEGPQSHQRGPPRSAGRQLDADRAHDARVCPGGAVRPRYEKTKLEGPQLSL